MQLKFVQLHLVLPFSMKKIVFVKNQRHCVLLNQTKVCLITFDLTIQIGPTKTAPLLIKPIEIRIL